MSRMALSKEKLLSKANSDLRHGDYSTDFFAEFGLRGLFIGEKTIGPEFSWVSHLLTKFLLKHPELYQGKKVLDLGCGSGVQLVAVSLNGAASVLGADVSDYAVRSTLENIKRFKLKNASCVKSDLFQKTGGARFDVIIFNHPFLSGKPGDEVEGVYVAEEKTLDDFFKQARAHLSSGGVIVMPFSHFGDHDPKDYARKFGYRVLKQESFENEAGKQSIYLLAGGVARV